jgi:hypothetical protein
MGFFTRIWVGFTQLLGLILPFFGRAADYRRWGPGLRWFLRILLLVGVLVLLYFINKWLVPPKWIKAPELVQRFWLPTLFLLFFLLSWLGWWLWKLLTPEAESSDFPDIDEAWGEACKALNQAGIELTEVPVFLVLGRPTAPEEAMMQAAQVQLVVRQAPRGDNAPLHVYANRDGIYVTCAGCSLLGKQAAILAGEEGTQAGGRSASSSDEGGGFDPTKTVAREDVLMSTMGRREGPEREVAGILLRAREEGREITAAERRRLRVLQRMPVPSLLRNPAEVERLTARLTHLCRLIARDRRPWVPVNGILLLLPFAATDTEEDAGQTGLICQQDLATARKVFQVHCPLLALVCDLETAPGFREFIDRISTPQRAQRVGQRFPLAPLVDPKQLPGILEMVPRVICQAVFPTWVYKFFRVEGAGRETTEEATRVNGQLYRLMYEMREREKFLAHILSRAAVTEQEGPLLFGGCYLAATGAEANDQAFVAGVFRRLYHQDEHLQDKVAWTAEKIAEEADYRRWTKIGYVAVAAFSVLNVVLLYLWLQQM